MNLYPNLTNGSSLSVITPQLEQPITIPSQLSTLFPRPQVKSHHHQIYQQNTPFSMTNDDCNINTKKRTFQAIDTYEHNQDHDVMELTFLQSDNQQFALRTRIGHQTRRPYYDPRCSPMKEESSQTLYLPEEISDNTDNDTMCSSQSDSSSSSFDPHLVVGLNDPRFLVPGARINNNHNNNQHSSCPLPRQQSRQHQHQHQQQQSNFADTPYSRLNPLPVNQTPHQHLPPTHIMTVFNS